MWLLVKGMITMKHSLPANNECPSILGSPKKNVGALGQTMYQPQVEQEG